jgi:hypothetical protein
MNFRDQLKRIRRMLRDPDGNIWTRSFIKTVYNDVQRDIQRRTRVLEQIAVINYPPRYQLSYIHDFEWAYLTSGQSQFYRALRYLDQSDYTFCHRWEAQSEFGVDGVVNDIGIQFSHPWEAFVGEEPGVPVAVKFPSNYHATKFLAWDRSPIEYKTKKSITSVDSSFENRTGTPVFYYREDDISNSFIPYPMPSTVSWDDVITPVADPVFVYSHEWEEDYVTGEKFTREDDDNERDYVFVWELGVDASAENVMRGMWLFEIGTQSAGQSGQVIYTEDDDNDSELGTVMRRDGSLISSDNGIAIDILNVDDEFLLIYDAEPTDIQDDTDESDFPKFLRKYVEYGVLERAFASKGDGMIQSLKDYWGTRYQMGIESIKLFKIKRKNDRDYVLKTQSSPARHVVRHAKLPSSYPAI